MQRSNVSRSLPVVLALLGGFFFFLHTSSVLASTRYGPGGWATIDPLVSAPGLSDSPLAGSYNPAAWPIAGRGGVYLGWDDYFEEEDRGEFHILAPDPLIFRSAVSFEQLGFAMTRSSIDGLDADHYDYVIGTGFGNRSAATGVSYAWTRGAERFFGESERITVGSIHRYRFLSIGMTRIWDRGPRDHSTQADIGIRPVGPRLTLFADAIKFDDEDTKDLNYGVGAEVQIAPGVSAALRFQPENDNAHSRHVMEPLRPEQWSFRIELAPTPDLRASYRTHSSDGDEFARTYAVEFRNGPHLGQWLLKSSAYPTIELTGSVGYRNYRFFDERTRLVALLDQIARYAEDPGVEGVVVHVSGLRLSVAGLWEVRAQLAALRDRGKKVIVQFDRLSLPQYAFATVADQIWMDPQGDLDLRGLHLGRTYYRRALEEAGVGFDELRFFTYKSALETYSRTSLSDADQEQLGSLLDDFYEEAVAQVAVGRGIARGQWDEIVNERGVVFAREAFELGLVDSIGTFEEAKKSAPKAESRGSSVDPIAMLGSLHGDPIWSGEEWGEPARIALLYAVGICAMDSGIQGRKLSKVIRAAREDRRIRAVVLRVDSPGGDPLPSDLVARELRETAKTKPVIISQGQLAASGGYWISMFGDEILVSPYTVTGSIGVILAHVWDDSLGTKVGWDYDGISRGRSADLARGPQVPLIGASIPHRPMKPEERARAEALVRQLYGDFVSSVAEGRGMEEEAVDAVGQGRVWSGRAGIANGLADRVGGLWDALALAKENAGIADNRHVLIQEGPGLGLFRPDLLVPKFLGVSIADPGSWVSPLADLFRSGESMGGADGTDSAHVWNGVGGGDAASSVGSGSAWDGPVGAVFDTGSAAGSRIRPRLGIGLWSQLSAAERVHLEMLDANLGRPLILAPPILLGTEVEP